MKTKWFSQNEITLNYEWTERVNDKTEPKGNFEGEEEKKNK